MVIGNLSGIEPDPAGQLPTTHRSRQATPDIYWVLPYYMTSLPCQPVCKLCPIRASLCWPVRCVAGWQVSLVYGEALFNVFTCLKFDNQTKQKKSSTSVYLWNYSANTNLKFVVEVSELVTYFPLAWSNLNRLFFRFGKMSVCQFECCNTSSS